MKELKDYTLKELEEEVKRRKEIIKLERKRLSEIDQPRCRNCVHIRKDYRFSWVSYYFCVGKSYKYKGRQRYYCTKECNKACEKFERREENTEIEILKSLYVKTK